MSRQIKHLKDWFQPKVVYFINMCGSAQYPLLITRTLTTETEQSLLYKLGRENITTAEIDFLKNRGIYPGRSDRMVTRAPHAEMTAHGVGLAFDCIPVTEYGAPIWDTPQKIWKVIYRIAEECGLDAMGDPWGEYLPWDKGHMQEPGWSIYSSSPPKLTDTFT